jgi:hypothetical protein
MMTGEHSAFPDKSSLRRKVNTGIRGNANTKAVKLRKW